MAAWGGLVPRQRRRGAAAGPASTPGLHMLARCAEAYVEDPRLPRRRGRAGGRVGGVRLGRGEGPGLALPGASGGELGAGERELRWREGAAAHLRHHFDARLLRRCAGAEEAAGGSGGPGGGREPLEGALCRYLRWRAAPCGGGLSLLPPAAPAPDEVRVVSTSGDLAAGVQRGAPPAASSRPMLNDLMFRKRPIAQG
ncbi:unnamed protein product [Prorocentrum cordatum]|uniref:Uncharacterized protein n=1 Tax=Prorocentrum cordatum TaxID=2364126 RepID=A0ABN9X3Y4_9DINO|nr:unnamed protein product [Polarella glacialis]